MKFTIQHFRHRFHNDEACLEEIMRNRYGQVSTCPKCAKQTKFHKVRARRCYECQWCGYQVYPTKNTPFEKTTTPLNLWFYAIYLMTATRSGVSAKELERQLGVTYKTAWRMAHEIRKLMGMSDGLALSGHVELDETYNGGVKRGGKRGRGAPGKTPVFGMAERGGDVRAVVVENVQKKTLMPHVEGNIVKGSTISSDELQSYNGLTAAGYVHGTVKHSAKEYVNGEHHVQSIEGFWSRLKLSIRGTHVWVSEKHLQKYVDEFAFRHNMRKQPNDMFDTLLLKLPKAA